MREPLASRGQIVRFEAACHRHPFPGQAGSSQRRPGGNRGQPCSGGKQPIRVPAPGDHCHSFRDQSGRHRHCQSAAREDNAPATRWPIQALLKRVRQSPEAGHRMPAPRIAQHSIDQHTQRDSRRARAACTSWDHTAILPDGLRRPGQGTRYPA